MTSARPRLIGLTGGLASGKSTVAGLLRARGLTVFDADALVAHLYRPGGEGAAWVREHLGPELLDSRGAVDRAALAQLVFADDAVRRRLEAAIHPMVGEEFFRRTPETDGPVVFEATLLVEAGFASRFDQVVTVEAPLEVRLRRAVARGMDEEDARSRLEAQGEGDARRAAAHLTIFNEGSQQELDEQIARWVETLLPDSGPSRRGSAPG